MCPACIATAAWIATGTSSAGVFFGLLIKNLPHRRQSRPGRSEDKASALQPPVRQRYRRLQKEIKR
jgi:hypothetical protein